MLLNTCRPRDGSRRSTIHSNARSNASDYRSSYRLRRAGAGRGARDAAAVVGAGVDHPRGAMDAFLVPINTSPGGRRLAGARRGRLVCLSERGDDDIIVEMHARLSRAAAAAAPADAPTHPPRVHRRRRNIYDAVS